MMTFLRKYAEAATIDFSLFEIDGIDFRTDAVSASGDITLNRDEAGAEQLDADAFVDEGTGYSLVISSDEMTAKRIHVHIVDQTSPKAWLDTGFIVETYGHASAMHVFDLDSATVTITNLDDASAGKLDDILDGTGGTGLKVSTLEVTSTTTLTGNVALGGTYSVAGVSTHTGAVTYTGGIVADITGALSGSVGSVSGAVGSVTGAVGSVTGAVGSVTGAVGSVGTGGITAATFGANAITAAKVAADVHAEAADAVWDELSTGHVSAGKAGQQLWTDVDAILDDTGSAGVIVASFSTAAKAAIESEVDDALGGGTGTALTAIPWNSAWDTEVQSEATDALNAYDPPTNTEMDAAFTAIKGATWASSTDTLEDIRDAVDADRDVQEW